MFKACIIDITAVNRHSSLQTAEILLLFILGSEYGIVLLSTVRSRPMSQDIGDTADIGWIRKNLGFVTDRHRICVGITRSKYGLVIVGEQINGCRVYIL